MKFKSDYLEWHEFQKLIRWFDDQIYFEENEKNNSKLRIYQTIIACGGYLGLTPSEIFSTTWDDVFNRPQKSISTVFSIYTIQSSDYFTRIVTKNYEYLKPKNSKNLILCKSNQQFMGSSKMIVNECIKSYMNNLHRHKLRVSTHTLRKTFAFHLWHDVFEESREGILLTCKFLNHKGGIDKTRRYLGIDPAEKKQIMVNID